MKCLSCERKVYCSILVDLEPIVTRFKLEIAINKCDRYKPNENKKYPTKDKRKLFDHE